MIFLKYQLDLASHYELRNLLELKKQKTREKCISRLTIGIIMVNLILASPYNKYHVSCILTNMLDP